MKLLDRYNDFYNLEMSGLPHGMAISVWNIYRQLQLECAIKAFARKYNYKESIPVEDLLYLAKELMKQGDGTVDESVRRAPQSG
jgi:hypothetical protein